MRNTIAAVSLVLFSIQMIVIELTAQTLPEAKTVKPQLFMTGLEFAEGPAFDKSGNFYVVNYRRNGTIGRVTPNGTASILVDLYAQEHLQPETRANGLKVDAEGYIIAAARKHLLRISPDGKSVVSLVGDYQGEDFDFLNDVALDPQGNIYFSDARGGNVYRLDGQSKKVTRILENRAFPNGLGVSPNGKYFCQAESQKRRVIIFDMQSDGTLKNERVLFEFPNPSPFADVQGEPDGMIFDNQGRLYQTSWLGETIYVIDVPSGKLLRSYWAGGSKNTNVHFLKGSLYTTVAAKEAVFRLELGIDGWDYNRP
jgi:gluconolactonase